MPESRKEPEQSQSICKTCKHGLVIDTVCPQAKYRDLFAFCGFFSDAPLKFRGAIVKGCSRWKKQGIQGG